MQYLGSVQNLDLSLSSWFPIGLSPRTMQYLGSVQNLEFSLSSWFPHRFESEDHAIP